MKTTAGDPAAFISSPMAAPAPVVTATNNIGTPQTASSLSSTAAASSNLLLRHETFTEAVPLALSSMAHANMYLDNHHGVLDGIAQVVHHSLLQCVNYARMVHPVESHRQKEEWTMRDLGTSRLGWMPIKEEPPSNGGSLESDDIPPALRKIKFQRCYSRNALIYLKPLQQKRQHAAASMPFPAAPFEQQQQQQPNAEAAAELARVQSWTQDESVLGRISLLYISTEPLTQGELDGTDRDDDMPVCLLYKALVEYRTLPPTGNIQAVQAEELSMLSFGGSIDDNVKYGALVSLYDEHAKYVLEIYSSRCKKYKFDLMDSTLSNGTIPTLPASREGDPFVKSLCVTVTDHAPHGKQAPLLQVEGNGQAPLGGSTVGRKGKDDDNDEIMTDENTEHSKTNAVSIGTAASVTKTTTSAAARKDKFAVTRMNLLLDGKLRRGNDFSLLPGFDDVVSDICSTFLLLNPDPAMLGMVIGAPSGHALLLNPSLAGRVYINGRYVTTWGKDASIGSHGVALFGMDLQNVPVWHGKIVDYEAFKSAYAVLLSEVLIDARLSHLDIATKLLYRLMIGRDPGQDEGLYDDGEASEGRADVNVDCLESQVLSSSLYDRVGIAPKALATRFAVEFGKEAFPCAPHEFHWVSTMLPDRQPVAAPQRLISILRRGGYFDTQRTVDDIWFADARSPRKGTEDELVKAVVVLLEQAGCGDVAYEQIVLTSAAVNGDIIVRKSVCRLNVPEQTYCVNDKFLGIAVNEYMDNENSMAWNAAQVKAYLLGMYIAREHPDGRVLPRYLLRVRR
jgi:hypothetical protein